MKVAGKIPVLQANSVYVHTYVYISFVSNGKYNVFRLKGYTRPVSVLKVRSSARSKFSSVAISTMEKMLNPIGMYYFLFLFHLGLHSTWLLISAANPGLLPAYMNSLCLP